MLNRIKWKYIGDINIEYEMLQNVNNDKFRIKNLTILYDIVLNIYMNIYKKLINGNTSSNSYMFVSVQEV